VTADGSVRRATLRSRLHEAGRARLRELRQPLRHPLGSVLQPALRDEQETGAVGPVIVGGQSRYYDDRSQSL